jgi:hypothetical protein
MIYPTHTIFLLLATGVAGSILYWFFVQTGLRRLALPGRRIWQIGSTVFLVAVFGLAASFSLTGRYTAQNANSSGLIPLLIAIMFGTNLTLLIVTQGYRQMVDGIPLHWLIGSHMLRIIPGIVFLALYDMRLLPPDVALQAGYGDILAGLIAVPVAYIIYNRTASARSLALVWSIFGLLDLINALYLGQTTIPAWTLALSRAGQPIDYVNLFVFLPSFMVPLYLVSQLWIFRRLLSLNVNAPVTHESRLPA